MSKKSLITLKATPQLWYQTQSNGLVEVIIIAQQCDDSTLWRLWVPAGDDEKVRAAIVKRMASDNGINLVSWSRLMSNTSPLKEYQAKHS